MPDQSGVKRLPYELDQWFREGTRLNRVILVDGRFYRESKAAPRTVLVRKKRRRIDGKPPSGL